MAEIGVEIIYEATQKLMNKHNKITREAPNEAKEHIISNNYDINYKPKTKFVTKAKNCPG